MRKIIIIAVFGFFVPVLHAQVLIDKPVILNGTTAADKQIENLSDSLSMNNILPAISVQNSQGRFGIASGTDSLSVMITGSVQFYTPGNLVYFQATASNSGPVAFSVNNLPFLPLKLYGNKDLKINQLKAGQVYCAIYSGTEFQLLSEPNTDCRTGFAEVNSFYCIEKAERASVTLFNAMMVCKANHSRLCKWGEWYYACQKGGIGLIGMTNANWEWTDDAANDKVRVVGNGACTALDVSNIYPSPNRPYRCCYTK